MIIKFYEISKINAEKINFLLFYGKNDGQKKEAINSLKLNNNKTHNYEEREILDNQNLLFENLLSKSLFEEQKTIIIKRATDKILNIIKELEEKKIDDLIIINSEILEKKSKLRQFFEKDKNKICVPFYPDTPQTLSRLINNFLRQKSITMSQANINFIINRCNGDREILLNELDKIEYFCKNKKKLTSENIIKLSNLVENHSISELIDNCLAKNKNKIINILNENNFSNEDCIIIARSFLIKAKKLLILSETYETNKNIDLTISSAKPPIFWKEKEITKQQIYKWKPRNIKQLIYALSETELQIKKDINNSINLITDFILVHSSIETNN